MVQVGSPLSKSLWTEMEIIWVEIGEEFIYVGGPYIIVPEHRQMPRPAQVLSTQAADSSHPGLFTPVRVSVALIN